MLNLKSFVPLCCLLLPGSVVCAQAKYTASRAGDLQVGGEVSGVVSRYEPVDTPGHPAPLHVLNFRPKFIGGGGYASFDFREHFGVELDIRHVTAHSGDGSSQTTYELGGRYVIVRRFNFAPYGKVMYGRGVYNYPQNLANLAFNLYSLGGGTDYRLTHSLNLRADYEYQSWIGVPLRNPIPQAVSLGVAYHFNSGKLGR